jgi:DNA-nicking Smr family endonuclease
MNDDPEQDNEDDDDLFRQAMKGVRPLKADNRIRHQHPPRKPPGRHPDSEPAATSERFTAGMYEEQCPENLYFARAGGAQKSLIRKLRSGKLTVDAVLDLHGLTVEQARAQLADFLEECRQCGYRHVIIVHGKGFRSQTRPVIKPMVNRWLQEAHEVLAFCSAQPKDGGTGAVYVLLRRGTRDE